MYETQAKPSKEECDDMSTQLENERILENVRSYRNTLLDQSDKYVTLDFPHPTPEKKQECLDYRQALRDLPSTTEDPANPVWPVQPSP